MQRKLSIRKPPYGSLVVQGALDLEEHIIAEQYGQEFVDRLRHWEL